MSRDLNDLHPDVRKKALLLIEKAAGAGFPIIVTHTYRSFEEQAGLYAKGRWRPGPQVTNANAGESWHNYRLAFDVVFSLPGNKISWEGPWDKLGALGKECGLEWGGDWLHPDRPHFEDKMNQTIAKLKAMHYVPEVAHA